MGSSTKKEVQRISDNQEARKAAIAQDIHLRDQVQREFDAMEEGREEARKEVALKMHKKQFTIETIAAATNLSMEDVLCIVKSDIQ